VAAAALLVGQLAENDARVDGVVRRFWYDGAMRRVLLVCLLLAGACGPSRPKPAVVTTPDVSPAIRAASMRPTAAPPIARSTTGAIRPRRSRSSASRPACASPSSAPAGGYTTELLARVVGPRGVVYGQNSPLILSRFAEKPWSERLAKTVNKNVVRADREFDDPLPPDAHDLDAVILILFYHDTVWMQTDRARMNAAIFKALKPGGVFGIVDHSARSGSGVADVQTLHRIEETRRPRRGREGRLPTRRRSDVSQEPSDPRDWNASPRVAAEKRGTSDRFVLKFVKP
jgi:predicted methyltransferase